MFDLDRVMQIFQKISGCRTGRYDEVLPIVQAAIKAVERAVDPEKVTEDNLPACEFAAACVAVYDFVCSECSREQTAVTANGNADNSADFSHRLKGSAELRNEAIRRIGWLMLDNFVFGTM